MTRIRVEQSRMVSHPLLLERLSAGKRLGAMQFVALVNEEESGLLIFENYGRDALGLIYEIYVLPRFRGMGVGSLLLSHAETVACIFNCTVLRIMARPIDQKFIDGVILTPWCCRKGFALTEGNSGWMQKSCS